MPVWGLGSRAEGTPQNRALVLLSLYSRSFPVACRPLQHLINATLFISSWLLWQL